VRATTPPLPQSSGFYWALLARKTSGFLSVELSQATVISWRQWSNTGSPVDMSLDCCVNVAYSIKEPPIYLCPSVPHGHAGHASLGRETLFDVSAAVRVLA
jgi:hypothetical protein